MRRAWMAFAAVGLVGLGFTAGQVFSQDMGGEKKPAGDAPAGPSPEETAAWMKYMAPGEQHQKMAAQAGDWSVATKVWMAGPGTPPTESTATAKFRMILGGRFQVMDYTGDMMGMPFEGMAISGYDNATKEYCSIWVDSMGTGMYHSRGKADEKGVVHTSGKMTEPSGNQMDVREVVTHKDKDTMHFAMFSKDPKTGQESQFLDLTYTRKK